MNPVTILIEEHKTIQKMVEILKLLADDPALIVKLGPGYFDKIIDFFKTYADRCHHGKEENILFRKLDKKNLRLEDKNLLSELLEEHQIARGVLEELVKTKKESVSVAHQFKILADLYENHMSKENKRFFLPAFNYFSEKEKQEILEQFLEADRKIVHKKYQEIIEELKKVLE